jgi:AraC-like DNA-binding protein
MIVERTVFSSPLVKIGMLRMPAHHPDFARTTTTDNCAIVFPREALVIQKDNGDRWISDPTATSLWNRGDIYTRTALTNQGAVGDWYAVDASLALEIVGSVDPCAENRPDRPFKRSHVRTDPATFLFQRGLLERVTAANFDSALEIEEAVIRIVRASARALHGEPRPSRLTLQEEIVERAEACLARRFDENLSVAEVAKEAGTSPFHLCRLFRKLRNSTLHGRLNEIRLRKSLDLLTDTSMELTAISLALGFSSHSHFTSSFRKYFGLTPSLFRARI